MKVLTKSEVDKFTGNEASGEALEFFQSLDEVVVDGRKADDEILCARKIYGKISVAGLRVSARKFRRT